MRRVVVLGGYGHLGRLCVREIVENTDAHVSVAGRSVQRADALALSYGKRVTGAYCNALDPRTVERALDGAAVVVACCGGDLLPPIDVALRVRVPFIGLTALPLDARTRAALGERAWQAQVPLVLQAGGVPGLPGIAAELLVRCVPEIGELRIATTGPWLETETALRDVRAYHERHPEPMSSVGRWLPLRVGLTPEGGTRSVRASASADLEGFAESHLVERLSYLEPPRGALVRGIERLCSNKTEGGFALTARATMLGEREPAASVDVCAASPLLPAAVIAGALVAAALEGTLPAGLLTPREALNPVRVLRALEKRGVRVATARAGAASATG